MPGMHGGIHYALMFFPPRITLYYSCKHYEHHIIISCALRIMGILPIYLLLLFDSNACCFDNQLVSWPFDKSKEKKKKYK